MFCDVVKRKINFAAMPTNFGEIFCLFSRDSPFKLRAPSLIIHVTDLSQLTRSFHDVALLNVKFKRSMAKIVEEIALCHGR